MLRRDPVMPLPPLMVFAVIVALLLAADVVRAKTNTYHDIKAFLIDSLASGGVDATIDGEFAQALARQTGQSGPVRARSTVTERFENGRCGRVETWLSQSEEGAPKPTIAMRVALCIDGSPYRSAPRSKTP